MAQVLAPERIQTVRLGDVIAHLSQAWHRVKAKKTAPGPDGVSVNAFASQADQHLKQLSEELQSGSFTFGPAQRLWIGKPKGGERGAINASKRDSVVLTAMTLALQGVLGTVISQVAFAYEKGKGAQRAIHEVTRQYRLGKSWVVRTDIKDCFDSVQHELMLAILEPFLDEGVRWLYRLALRIPILDGGVLTLNERGLPQGSPLSPILMNLFLRDLDGRLSSEWGTVRFADDLTILASSAGEAGRALEVIEGELHRLGLELNPEKTRITSFRQGFTFLGFAFLGEQVRIDPERIEAFKDHLEHLLIPRIGSFSREAIPQANDLIKGWRNYFHLGQVRLDLEPLQEWIEARFHSKASSLERLIPEPSFHRAPSLGGYEGSKPRSKPHLIPQPSPNPKPPDQQKSEVASPAQKLETASNALKSEVALGAPNFRPLPDTAALQHIVSELRRALVFHKAGLASYWKTEAGQAATAGLAAVMSGKLPLSEALLAYDQAMLTVCPPGGDARGPRGVVRRALRMACWEALLEVGLEVGAEPGHKVPRLVDAWAAALEAPIADFATIGAVRLGNYTRAQEHLERHLNTVVNYQGKATPWREILRLEALRLKTALEGSQPYQAWLWGVK